LEKVFFGFDIGWFYLRIDLTADKITNFPASESILVHIVSPEKCCLALECVKKGDWRLKTVFWPDSHRVPVFAAKRILELGLPLEAIGVRQPTDVKFFVSVLENDQELERFPSTGSLAVPTDPWGLDQQEWVV
jgi:hypothetical protein